MLMQWRRKKKLISAFFLFLIEITVLFHSVNNNANTVSNRREEEGNNYKSKHLAHTPSIIFFFILLLYKNIKIVHYSLLEQNRPDELNFNKWGRKEKKFLNIFVFLEAVEGRYSAFCSWLIRNAYISPPTHTKMGVRKNLIKWEFFFEYSKSAKEFFSLI